MQVLHTCDLTDFRYSVAVKLSFLFNQIPLLARLILPKLPGGCTLPYEQLSKLFLSQLHFNLPNLKYRCLYILFSPLFRMSIKPRITFIELDRQGETDP